MNYNIYEFYKVQKLQDSAWNHKNEINKVAYPNVLKLLTYDEKTISRILNSMAYVRVNDETKFQRAKKALEINMELQALNKNEYPLE